MATREKMGMRHVDLRETILGMSAMSWQGGVTLLPLPYISLYLRSIEVNNTQSVGYVQMWLCKCI